LVEIAWQQRAARVADGTLGYDWRQRVPEARDEYDGYLGPLVNRLHDGANAQAVAEYLAGVQTEQMGLPATADQLHDVANRVVAWYASEVRR
jgi:hypothetical protein